MSDKLIAKEGEKTHMVAGAEAPRAKVETVKIKVMRPIMVGGIVRQPGELVEVTQEEAKEFCTPSKGHHAFRGERHADEEGGPKRFDLTRAKLVTKDD